MFVSGGRFGENCILPLYTAAVIRKRDYNKATLDRFFDILAWSFNLLLDGRMPTIDVDNHWIVGPSGQIAGEYLACLTHIRGDWQWYCEIFGFPQWNGAVRMCWLCLASSVNVALSFTDCGQNARRRRTNLSHDAYVAMMQRDGCELPSMLLRCIGLRLENIMIDVLYCLDLGVTGHVLGNILWETVLNRDWGFPNHDENCKALEQDLRAWYKSTKCCNRLQHELTKERLRQDGQYPKLRAKGAETRHLAKYGLEIARRFSNGSEHDQLKVLVAERTVTLYDIMAEEGRFMSEDAQKRFERCSQRSRSRSRPKRLIFMSRIDFCIAISVASHGKLNASSCKYELSMSQV